ncbi:MAG TPA: MFS transporter [Gaiellaceae bacterium]|nr:MFS transporter [Gaiellaceae bacterium]
MPASGATGRSALRRPRLGPLAEREFRLLFLGRTVSFVGGSFGIIALAFAVLDLTGSKADLGYVLAARAVPTVAFLLVGGIWADRLPRHLVMVGSNLLSGASQATVAALLFSGHARVWQLAALAAVNGTSLAFFFPASSGIVPQTVPERLLQPANALLRLGLNGSAILGGAAAGLVVYATSPATGIAIDAASFFAAAALLAAMRLPRSLHMQSSNFVADLKLGWREFSGRAWLWAIVLQFGFVNAVLQGTEGVLGPAVSKQHFHGAAGWGLIGAAQSVGLVAGGILMLRLRPRRLLLVATLGFLLSVPLLFGLAIPLPLAAVLVLALAAGIGTETFGVLWDTTMQQEIPLDRLSRVSSYDALGSFALIPIGLAVAGPVAEAVGTRSTLFAAGLISLSATLAVLFVEDVRVLRRREPVALRGPAVEGAA